MQILALSLEALAMEVGTPIQEKAGPFGLAWGWFKALPGKSKAMLMTVSESIKELGQDDPRRVIHSLKVGLALTLVSILYYCRTLYQGFGVSGMWAVLTVVVVFEFTVGGTLSKSLNRGLATLLAGALGVGAQHLANLFGEQGKPVVLAILVFVLAAAATFTRFFPRIKARYDYGVLIFILTFSLVSVSGYRVEELIVLAHQRLSTIAIGGAACILISVCICPVWAGENLHKLIVSNIEELANYLEGFGGEYFQYNEIGDSALVTNKDKSFLQGYRSVLSSKSTEESMANLARWEPRHGRFGFRHPWKQYLKIGALARQCAYQIEALNSHLDSDIQAPQEFKTQIQESCTKLSEESSKALKSLASAIETMTYPSSASLHIQNSKTAMKSLTIVLKSCSTLEHSDLLAIIPAAAVASILIEITKNVEELSESVHELASQAHFKSVSPEKPQLLHRGSVKPVLDGDYDDHIVIAAHGTSTDSPESYQKP